jgi:hypothetical protein
VFNYYFRLAVTDWNGNTSYGSATQVGDVGVAVPAGCAVRLRLVGPPALPELVAAKTVDIIVYRTQANVPEVYYKIATLPIGFNGTSQYFTWTDQVPDWYLTEDKLDELSVSINNNLGTDLTSPPAGNFMTSASNRLFVADFVDKHQIEVAVIQNPLKQAVDKTIPLSDITYIGNPSQGSTTLSGGGFNYTLLPTVKSSINSYDVLVCGTHIATAAGSGNNHLMLTPAAQRPSGVARVVH